MTEAQLRQKVADIINGWIGAQRGDATHARILSIYNNHRPLARNYPVQVNDAYCATGASAAYIEAGIAEYTGTECGVERWVDIAKAKGIWQENDAYRPGVGDAICYDWDDDGAGDNRGYSDHVGIVVAVSGDAITVTECNINGGKVGQRSLLVNGRYIRGYICPPFAQIAAQSVPPDVPIQDDPEPAPALTRAAVLAALGDAWVARFSDLPDWAKPEMEELVKIGALKGAEETENLADIKINGTVNSFVRPCIIALRTVKAFCGAQIGAAIADKLSEIVNSLRGE